MRLFSRILGVLGAFAFVTGSLVVSSVQARQQAGVGECARDVVCGSVLTSHTLPQLVVMACYNFTAVLQAAQVEAGAKGTEVNLNPVLGDIHSYRQTCDDAAFERYLDVAFPGDK